MRHHVPTSSPSAGPFPRATVTLPASTHVEYKYIKKDGNNTVIWESGANRVLQTGAGGTSQTTSDAWK